MNCHFGSATDTPCPNPAVWRVTPQSYVKFIFPGKYPDGETLGIDQETVDHFGHWCDEHRLQSMATERIE